MGRLLLAVLLCCVLPAAAQEPYPARPEQMMSVEVSKSPQEFTERVRRETQSWGEFLRDAGIKID